MCDSLNHPMVQSMFMHDVVTSVMAAAYFIHFYPLNLSSLTPCICPIKDISGLCVGLFSLLMEDGSMET